MESHQFRHFAQVHIDTTRDIFGVELDFDEKSILELDNLIQKGWPDEPPIQIDNVILLIGSFLGEAIIKTLNGEWEETQQGWGIRVKNATLMVFSKVKKRLLNGMEDSISFYYTSTKKMLEDDFRVISK
ncbi:MAG: hypothetical protein COT89_01920 [Candidatus Colwellbacteria bacterium CG10_big_fil_rev_8_21_14_0_10_42_22]|uniref:Uncharacterized protein n=1 Tax=Candidatus Colwellbacteria bacterium CG10_big_fil_rev_8_21_14_0_10_42_22 TaxID=1974540 RepID=A0A2H0VFV2_9BACT|nr:MAG: hypothetical protein COT89_01920 [Candidatus Colwellbacteria bacterium CG10_big_fil_rev_8_21_14_0_10_42_22]